MTTLLNSTQVVELINSSGWKSRAGTPLTTARLRVIRQRRELGCFPEPADHDHHAWPLWHPDQIQAWLDEQLETAGMWSTNALILEVARRTGRPVTIRVVRQALTELYPEGPLVRRGTHFWPGGSPERVALTLTQHV